MPDSPGLLDRLTRIGAMLMVVGAVAAVATVVPHFTGGPRLPLLAYLLAMLMPAGFATVLAGLVLTARSRSRD